MKEFLDASLSSTLYLAPLVPSFIPCFLRFSYLSFLRPSITVPCCIFVFPLSVGLFRMRFPLLFPLCFSSSQLLRLLFPLPRRNLCCFIVFSLIFLSFSLLLSVCLSLQFPALCQTALSFSVAAKSTLHSSLSPRVSSAPGSVAFFFLSPEQEAPS